MSNSEKFFKTLSGLIESGILTTKDIQKEIDEWQEKELDWWAERQIPLVAFMAFVLLFVFGSMLMAFYLIGTALG